MSSNEETFGEIGVGDSYTKSLFTFNEADADFLSTNDFVALDLDGVVDSFKSAAAQPEFAGSEDVVQLQDLVSENQEENAGPDEDNVIDHPAKIRKKRKKRARQNLEPRSIRCDLCDETFMHSSELKYHRASMHHLAKLYRCEECSKGFNFEKNLFLHIASHSTTPAICPECGRMFQRLSSFVGHLETHAESDNFKCQACGKEFEFEEYYERHLEKDHRGGEMMAALFVKKRNSRNINVGYNGKFVCKSCGKRFPKPSLLLRHEIAHAKVKPFECLECNKRFSQKASLDRHSMLHSGIKPYDCPECGMGFSQRTNLITHIKRVHTTNQNAGGQFPCNSCSCVFSKLKSLTRHKTLKHSNKTENKKTELSFTEILEHIMSLHDQNISPQTTSLSGQVTMPVGDRIVPKQVSEDQQSVPECPPTPVKAQFVNVVDRLYPTKERVNRTVKEINIDGIKWLECPYCPKRFQMPFDIVRHLRTHTKEKPWKCEYCGRKFALKNTMELHLKVHRKKPNEITKLYHCTYCQMSFDSIRRLDMHVRIHSNYKPYACSICFKTFKSNDNLRLHKTIHEPKDPDDENIKRQLLPPIIQNPEEKPEEDQSVRIYQCEKCGQRFKKSSHLAQHDFSHLSLKAFQCEICNKYFSTKSSLGFHQKIHLGHKTAPCEVCHKQFCRNSDLKRHKAVHSNFRNFMCPYCKKTFKRKSSCKQHISTLHLRDVVTTEEVENTASVSDNENNISDVNEDSRAEPHEHQVDHDPNQLVFNMVPINVSSNLNQRDQLERNLNLRLNLNQNDQEGAIFPIQSILNPANESDAIFLFPPDLNQPGATAPALVPNLNQSDASFCFSPDINNSETAFQVPSDLNQTNGPEVAFSNSTDFKQASQTAINLLPAPPDFNQLNELNQPELVFPVHSNLKPIQTEAVLSFPSELNLSNQTETTHSVPPDLNQMDRPEIVQNTQNIPSDVASPGIILLLHPNQPNSVQQRENLIVVDLRQILNQNFLPSKNVDLQNKTNQPEGNKILVAAVPQETEALPVAASQTFDILPEAASQELETFPADVSREIEAFQAAASKQIEVLPATASQEIQFLRSIDSQETQLLPVAASQGIGTFSTASSQDIQIIPTTASKKIEMLPATAFQETEIIPAAPPQSKPVQPEFISISDLPNYSKNLAKNIVVVSHEKNSDSCDNLPEAVLNESEPQGEEFLIQDAGTKLAELTKTKASKAKPPHPCSMCKKVFQKPSDLVRHIRTHTKERPFQCHTCSKTFSLKSTLDNHKFIHDKDRPSFICHVCGKNYAAKNVLRTHLRMHTGERPFKCDICSKTFRTSGHRTAHIRVHAKMEATRKKKKTKVLN